MGPGLAGRQEELGVNPTDLVKRTTREGEPLVFFCLVVSQPIPFGSTDYVGAHVEYAMDETDGHRRLGGFPSDVIGPEAPSANIRVAADRRRNLRNTTPPTAGRRTHWP